MTTRRWTRREVLGLLAAGTLVAAGGGDVLAGGGERRAVPLTASSDLVAGHTSISNAPSRVPPSAPLIPAEAVPGTGRPPQFVVVSFDGSADDDLLTHWRHLATATGARFTFFLSGTYLLLRANAARYQAPRHGAGVSDIGFFPVPHGMDPAEELTALVRHLGDAYLEGHEVGTHYNGHFCGRSLRAVGAWGAEDWRSELDQFDSFLDDVGANNGLAGLRFPFASATVIGGRTPCLEGDFTILYPELAGRGFRYDASASAIEGTWPTRRLGLWSFPLHAIPLAGRRMRVLSMDYNLYFNQTGARPAPADQVPAIRAQALKTYRDYFAASYTGSRAPISIGHHFTRWNGGAYVDALTTLVTEMATTPEVQLVTYRTLCDWLDARAPEELAAFARGTWRTSVP